MPPRAAGQQTQDQYRASPAPEQPGHPGYAGMWGQFIIISYIFILLYYLVLFYFSIFFIICLGYPNPSPGHAPAVPHPQGRLSVTSEGYHGYPAHPAPDQDPVYGNNGHYPHHGNYAADHGNYAPHPAYSHYDPNLTAAGSVFEESAGEQGYLSPLPGSLGGSATPGPAERREAPRAVFDEDQEAEPAPAPHPMFSRPKSSVGSDQKPGLFLFYFIFIYLHLFFY